MSDDALVGPASEDAWAPIRAMTPARIGLRAAGRAIAGAEVLALQTAHARARRAVDAVLDPADLAPAAPFVEVESRAPDRAAFVRRPDLGRALHPDCEGLLARAPCDVVFVIADGLSAIAAARQAPRVLRAVRPHLPGWSIGPVIVAHRARVALGDAIGARLGAAFVVMMIGERPGLSVSDSLSLYLTRDPAPGRMDAQRNCISNIHDRGLPVDEAARRLAWLLEAARALGATGIALKDGSMGGAPRALAAPAPARTDLSGREAAP